MSNQNEDRLPPNSPASECGIIGCALQSQEAALTTVTLCDEAGLTAEWFYDHRCIVVWEHLKKLADKGQPDFLSLVGSLNDAKLLENIGGSVWLGEVQDSVASAANLPTYLDTVRERWQLRKLVAVCSELGDLAMHRTDDVEGLMATAEAQLTAVTTPALRSKEKHIREIMPGVVADMENYHKGKLQLQGLPTGFNYLDKVIGGVGADYYWVLAGRPGSGKTTFALDVINHLATEYLHWEPTGEKHEDGSPKMKQEKGIPIGVFSLEMSSKSLGKRLLFSKAHVSAGKFKQGFMSNDDFMKLTRSLPSIMASNIYLDEEPSQTIGKIRAKAQRMARQYGIKLFVLDYLQLVLPNERSSRPDRVSELNDISAQLVYLKKKLNIPWLVLAQMNRNIETTERPRVPVMSDLKDCGAIEQDADVIQFLHRPSGKAADEDYTKIHQLYDVIKPPVEFTERPRRIDAVIAKNRDGATGIAQLLFHSNQFHFEDWHAWQVDKNLIQPAKGEAKPDNVVPMETQDEL